MAEASPSLVCYHDFKSAVLAVSEELSPLHGAPFSRKVILVDSMAMANNLKAHLSSTLGMTLGFHCLTFMKFLKQLMTSKNALELDYPLPAVSDKPFHPRALSLAILEELPNLKASSCAELKGLAEQIDALHDLPTKLFLAGEMARSFDKSLEYSLSPSMLKAWPIELRKHLLDYAERHSLSKLRDYLVFHSEIFEFLTNLSKNLDQVDQLKAHGMWPSLIMGFDLSPSVFEIEAIRILGKIGPFKTILIDSDIEPVGNPSAKAWMIRSSKLTTSVKTALGPPTRGPAITERSANGILAKIQQEILGGPGCTGPVASPDHSLTIHHVTSIPRASEVACEAIQSAIIDYPDLLPEQVIVVADDPRAAIPHLEAAFLSSNEKKSLPVSFTGAKTSDRDPAIAAFLKALELAPTSFQPHQVFDWLRIFPVAESFQIDEENLSNLELLCENAGLRSYLDSAHREKDIEVSQQEHVGTWKAALESLALSMGTPNAGDDAVTAGDVVPAGRMKSSQMGLLDSMAKVIECLRNLHKLAHGGTVDEMVIEARSAAGIFLGARQWSGSLARIQSALDSIQEDARNAGYSGRIDFRWFSSRLSTLLNRSGVANRVLWGGISVLSPAEARGRFARVAVFLLSDRFPREKQPCWPEHLLNVDALIGGDDQDLRDFQSIFLNIKQRVALIATSMNDRTHERQPMSSVVHDVRSVALSYSNTGYSLIEVDEPVSSHSVALKPKPFPNRRPGVTRGRISLHGARTTPHGLIPQVFAVPDPAASVPSEIDVNDFASFFARSSREFIKARKLFLQEIDQRPATREDIDLSFLDRWSVKDYLFNVFSNYDGALSKDELMSKVHKRLAGMGKIRAGFTGLEVLINLADQSFTDLTNGVLQLAQAVTNTISIRKLPINIAVPYSIFSRSYQLLIKGFVDVADSCLIGYRPGKFKEQIALEMSVKASVCASAGHDLKWNFHYIEGNNCDCATNDSDKNFTKILKTDTSPLPLVPLVKLWHIGMQTPLPIFPETLDVAIRKGDRNPASNHCINLIEANNKFLSEDQGWGAGESHDVSVKSLFRGTRPLFASFHDRTRFDFDHIGRFLGGGLPDIFP